MSKQLVRVGSKTN